MAFAGFRRGRSVFFLAAVIACARFAAGADVHSPLSPQESLAHFQLEAGLAIELVACEPEVVDPIAIRFDEDGRLWVVEMRDYPNGPAEGQQPLSQIRVLTDVDGDGRYENSRVFADHLLFPTGIQPWQGGVIVTLAGAVMYLKDTDGDGRSDVHETWYRGFVAENPQLRVNHPRIGLDGRVTIANGLRGGTIENPRRPALPSQKPLSISGMDFCFDPRTGDCQAVSGNGQFGLAFDDFGNRFVCNNRAPLQHVVLDNKYLARNPFLAVAAVVKDVAAQGEQSHVYPLTSAWTTSNLHAGQFTAACGVEIYRGDALGEEYRGNGFTCEPTGSLVHREVLAADGVSFVSHAPHEGKEFLATPDAWFRPVNLEIGPDGALYVVDMYRAVIEHPQFMPSELQQRPDLRLGDDRGRIYRVMRAGEKPKRETPKMSTASSGELVDLLRHDNAWWRETAARLLLERQDPSATKPLESLAREAPESTARVHALWALDVSHALAPEVIVRALADEHPRVREQAVALAEPRLAEPRLPEAADLHRRVMAATADADARVRFRAALALGGLPTEEVVAPLLAVALRQPHDPWTRAAVASAMPTHIAPMLVAALTSDRVKSKQYGAPELLLVRELAVIVGSRRDAGEVAQVLALVGDAGQPSTVPAREVALLGLAQGIERRGGTLAEFVAQLPAAQSIDRALNALFDRAAAEAANRKLAEDVRASKIDLLKVARSLRAREVLLPILTGDASQALRVHSAAALAAQTDDSVGPALVAAYSAQTPPVRRAILDALVSDPARANLLLDEVESKRLARTEIDAPRRTGCCSTRIRRCGLALASCWPRRCRPNASWCWNNIKRRSTSRRTPKPARSSFANTAPRVTTWATWGLTWLRTFLIRASRRRGNCWATS